MSLVTTPGIVLRSQRLWEADKLVTFFTAQCGKVRAVAKGARRPRSRFGASLEPFSHSSLVLFEKRPGNLSRINQAAIMYPFKGIRKDLATIEAASRIVHLVYLLLPDAEANLKIFDLLLKALFEVEQNGKDLELITRFFEIHLLKYSGYLPKVDQCLKCHRPIDNSPIFFSAQAGGTLCMNCLQGNPAGGRPVSKGTLAFMVQTVRLGWEKQDRLKAANPIRNELRNILEDSIGHITGRPFSHAVLTPFNEIQSPS